MKKKVQIIDMLNSIKKYDKKIKISKYGNGKPEPSNIQIFSYDNSSNNNFMYILEKDDDNIMISQPHSEVGYIVKQPELNKLLKRLRK